MSDSEIWTIRTASEWTEGYLGRKGDPNPRLSTQWLLSAATGLSRIQLYADFDRPLSMDERDVLRVYVSRRGKGEPLQYISGEVGFRHITLKVKKGVLIPRPETEVLVSEVLAGIPAARRPRSAEFLAEMHAYDESLDEQREAASESEDRLSSGLTSGDEGSSLKSAFSEDEISERVFSKGEKAPREIVAQNDGILIADICTGSGCIACSLAFEHPDVSVIATDISPKAIELAKENVSQLRLGDRVQVLEGDLGDPIDPSFFGKIDVVVSNPPYIPTAVMQKIPHEVTSFEPALALDGGKDGLDFYRRILEWSKYSLKSDGMIAFELHEDCLGEAARIALENGFSNVRIVNDLAGRPRVLTGILKRR